MPYFKSVISSVHSHHNDKNFKISFIENYKKIEQHSPIEQTFSRFQVDKIHYHAQCLTNHSRLSSLCSICLLFFQVLQNNAQIAHAEALQTTQKSPPGRSGGYKKPWWHTVLSFFNNTLWWRCIMYFLWCSNWKTFGLRWPCKRGNWHQAIIWLVLYFTLCLIDKDKLKQAWKSYWCIAWILLNRLISLVLFFLLLLACDLYILIKEYLIFYVEMLCEYPQHYKSTAYKIILHRWHIWSCAHRKYKGYVYAIC